jgi:hypothetical protein
VLVVDDEKAIVDMVADVCCADGVGTAESRGWLERRGEVKR